MIVHVTKIKKRVPSLDVWQRRGSHMESSQSTSKGGFGIPFCVFESSHYALISVPFRAAIVGTVTF